MHLKVWPKRVLIVLVAIHEKFTFPKICTMYTIVCIKAYFIVCNNGYIKMYIKVCNCASFFYIKMYIKIGRKLLESINM